MRILQLEPHKWCNDQACSLTSGFLCHTWRGGSVNAQYPDRPLLLDIHSPTGRSALPGLPQNRLVANLDQPARRGAPKESMRQSVSLPSRIAKRVRALAETRHTTASRVLVDLIETGLQTKQAQHDRFFELTDQLVEAKDPVERKRLQEELARISCCK
jgi:hypothetical protein